MRGMKIGVNARFLGKPYTGIGQYTLNMVKELADADSGNEYVLIVPEDIGRGNKFPANVRTHVLPEMRRGMAGMKKTWWEQISVPSFFEKEKVDMAFFPYPSNPWFSSFYKRKRKIKTIVTVHDTVPWENRKYRRGVLSKLYHFQSKKALKKVDLVLTVSDYSKRRIEKVCHIPAAKIEAIHNAASEVFMGPTDEDVENRVLEKFRLRKAQFFLYCGGYDERKNVKKLIEEYLTFADSLAKKSAAENSPRETIPALVLAGDKLFANKLYVEIDETVGGKEEKIIRTGFLSDEELKALYQNCLAYVNLSKEEGFNIPIVEAAYCGAPLILSDIEVHKEIAKSHALFVDISKNGDAGQALKKMLDHDSRVHYAKKSHELSKEYSWKKSAQKLKEVLFS